MYLQISKTSGYDAVQILIDTEAGSRYIVHMGLKLFDKLKVGDVLYSEEHTKLSRGG